MNKMFTQPTGPVAKQTNKQAIARLLGLPVQAVQIINVNSALSSSAVSVSPAQTFSRLTGLIKGFSAPMFNAASTGLISSINTYNASGGFTVSLFNPTADAITPSITSTTVHLELV